MAALYLPWTWSEQLGSLGGDSAVYLLTAQAFAPYLPPDPVARAFADHSLYPPLYPLLLALTGGAASLPLAHAATTVCLLAALGALYALALGIGLARPLALATTALFAVAPGTYVQALQVLSEAPYLALSLGALALLAGPATANRCWAAVALVAAALLTRSAGVALLSALAIALLTRRPRGWPAMAAAAVAPAAAWSVLHSAGASYGAGFAQRFAGIDGILAQVRALGIGTTANLVQTLPLVWPLVPLALAGMALAMTRLAQRQPDAWYFFAYLGLVAIWPYPAEAQRLAWVIVPLWLAYAVAAGAWLAARLADRGPAVGHAVRWLAPAMLAMLQLPGFELAMERRFHPVTATIPAIAHLPDWYEADAATALEQAQVHLDVAQAIAQLGARVPPGECIYSIKPALVAFLAHRAGSGPPDAGASDAEFEARLAAGGCRHMLVLGLASPSYPAPYYPLDRLGDRAQVIEVRTARANEAHVVAALLQLPP